MAITPNYSWPLPDDTDLVKDGAEAIRDLGNAIDTTVDGLGVGLVHINTTSFSAVASESFNNVFSATYDNYKIVMQIATAGNAHVQLRLRASGTDNSTASSYAFNVTANNSDGQHTQTNADTKWQITYFTAAADRFFTLEIARPFLAANAEFVSQGNQNNALQIASGSKLDTNVYDGFTIFGSTGNISGKVFIYGMRQ
jgi:hypothetical protein